jgi:hypothetical protein
MRIGETPWLEEGKFRVLRFGRRSYTCMGISESFPIYDTKFSKNGLRMRKLSA